MRGGVLRPPDQLTFTLTAFGFEGHSCSFSTITPTPYNCGGALNGAIVTKSPTFTDSPDNSRMITAPIRTVVVTELDKVTAVLFRLSNNYPNTINIRVFNPH